MMALAVRSSKRTEGSQSEQGPQGEQGIQGEQGPQGDPGSSSVLGFYRVESQVMIPANSGGGDTTAHCNFGDVLTGGGYRTLGLDGEEEIGVPGAFANIVFSQRSRSLWRRSVCRDAELRYRYRLYLRGGIHLRRPHPISYKTLYLQIKPLDPGGFCVAPQPAAVEVGRPLRIDSGYILKKQLNSIVIFGIGIGINK